MRTYQIALTSACLSLVDDALIAVNRTLAQYACEDDVEGAEILALATEEQSGYAYDREGLVSRIFRKDAGVYTRVLGEDVDAWTEEMLPYAVLAYVQEDMGRIRQDEALSSYALAKAAHGAQVMRIGDEFMIDQWYAGDLVSSCTLSSAGKWDMIACLLHHETDMCIPPTAEARRAVYPWRCP